MRMPSLSVSCVRLGFSLVWLLSTSAAFSWSVHCGSARSSSLLTAKNAHDRSRGEDYVEEADRHVAPAFARWALPKPALHYLGAAFLATSLSLPVWMSAAPLPARAESPRVVGRLQGSGLVFKDTLQIESFDDPKVQGVTLYISNFERPITERLTSNFLQDPSYASVACAKTGPIKIADNIATGTGGEEVFEESRSLLFKTLRVQRIYDADKKTVVYVSFNTRLDKSDDTNKSRFKSSLCAVSLE